MVLFVAARVEAAGTPEAKADFLANKKTNIEARGKVYNPTQWSDHFDLMDLDKDGLLTSEERGAYDAAKHCRAAATGAGSGRKGSSTARTWATTNRTTMPTIPLFAGDNRWRKTNSAVSVSSLTLDIGDSLLDIGCSIRVREGLK